MKTILILLSALCVASTALANEPYYNLAATTMTYDYKVTVAQSGEEFLAGQLKINERERKPFTAWEKRQIRQALRTGGTENAARVERAVISMRQGRTVTGTLFLAPYLKDDPENVFKGFAHASTRLPLTYQSLTCRVTGGQLVGDDVTAQVSEHGELVFQDVTVRVGSEEPGPLQIYCKMDVLADTGLAIRMGSPLTAGTGPVFHGPGRDGTDVRHAADNGTESAPERWVIIRALR